MDREEIVKITEGGGKGKVVVEEKAVPAGD